MTEMSSSADDALPEPHLEHSSPSSASSNIALISEGRTLTYYAFSPSIALSQPEDAQPSTSSSSSLLYAHSVFLFYCPPPSPSSPVASPTASAFKLGSLNWCAPGSRDVTSACRLPVHLISDIYLDHQHGREWKHATAFSPPPPPSACFTLVSRRLGIHLCLQAESELVRNGCLAGIRELFELRGRRVVTERVKQKRMSAVDTLRSTLSRSPLVSAMQQGQHVTRLLPQSLLPVASFLHFLPSHSKLGSLHWTDDPASAAAAGALTDSDNTLPLHLIADVYGGKSGMGSEAEATEAYADDCCMSVVGRDGHRALHLVCEKEARRAVWLDGIREVYDIVRRMGKAKETEEERRQREEAEEAVSRTERAATAAAMQQQSEQMLLHMDDSALSTAVSAGIASLPSLPPVSQLLPADSDVEVDGGFSYDVEDSVRLDGEDVEQRETSELPLSSVRVAGNALAVGETYRYLAADEPSTSYYERSITHTGSATADLSSEDAVVFSSHPAVLALTAGFTFLSYSLSSVSSVHIQYDPSIGKLGTLHYTLTADDGSTAAAAVRSLAVSALCDVFVGKQSAELRSHLACHVDALCCFTIASRDVALHLQAASEEERGLFLDGVKQLFLGQGRRVHGRKVGADDSAAAADDLSRTRPISGEMLRQIGQHQQPVGSQAAVTDAAQVAPVSEQEIQQQKLEVKVEAAVQEESNEATDAAAAVLPLPVPITRAASAAAAAAPSAMSAVFSSSTPLANAVIVADTSSPHSPVATPPAAVPSTPTQYLLSSSPALSVLRTGATFTAFFGSPPMPTLTIPIFLFYSPASSRLGSLHWCEPATPFTCVDGQSLPLHRFSDVVQGKGTAELRSTAAGGFAASLCFSLVTKTRLLNLAARTEKVRADWVEAIKAAFVMTRGGGKAAEEAEGGKAEEPKPSVAVLSRIPTLAVDTAMQLMSSGYLVSFVWQQEGETRKAERLLWWDESDQGQLQLCWNDRGERKRQQQQQTQQPQQWLAVADVKDAVVGKELPIFSWSRLSTVDAEQCVTLYCSGAEQQLLHVVAEREESKASFVSALRAVLQHLLPTVAASSAAVSRAASPSIPLSPLQPTSPLDLLSTGCVFMSYSRSSPSPSLLSQSAACSSAPVFVFWDNTHAPSKYGSFYTCAPSAGRSFSTAYPPFSEILNGKRTPELLSPAAASAPSDCCLSLIGKGGAGLHLQAATDVVRNVWIEAIKTLYAHCSKKPAAAAAAGQDAVSALSAVSLHCNDGVLASKLPLLVQGVNVVHHIHAKVGATGAAASVQQQRVFLSFEPTAGPRGRLWWQVEDDRLKGGAKSPDCCVDLHELQGVKVGSDDIQQQQQQQRAVKLEADRCLSLWSASRRLDVEFLTVTDRRAFLHALHAVLVTNRDLSTLRDTTLVVRNNAALQIINSPMGLCELHSASASPPSTLCLTLPWGRMYCTLPAPQLVKFVAVFTPQGLGYVVLPVDEGWGKRVAVEVWMRAAPTAGQAAAAALGGVVKVMAAVLDLTVIPVMPASMIDMVRQWFAGVRYATPLKGMGGHRGRRSTPIADAAAVREVNTRYQRAASIEAAPVAPATPPTSAVAAAVAAPSLPLLRFGHLLHHWRSSASSPPSRQAVLVLLDDASNSLHWHDVTAPKGEGTDSRLALEELQRVVKGKSAGGFGDGSSGAAADDSCCFSLLTRSGRVSFQAISSSAREEWLQELTRWLDWRNKLKPAAAQPPVSNPPEALGRQPAPPASPSAPSAQSGIDAFTAGEYFMSYSSSSAAVRIFLRYEPASSRLGSFFWCSEAEAATRPSDPERRIPLISLCDLTIGKGGEGWAAEDGQRADAFCCFSLKTRKLALHLEAERGQTRDAWVGLIKSVISNAGKKVIDAEDDGSRTAPASV